MSVFAEKAKKEIPFPRVSKSANVHRNRFLFRADGLNHKNLYNQSDTLDRPAHKLTHSVLPVTCIATLVVCLERVR